MREARYVTKEYAQAAARYIRGMSTTVIRHGDNDYRILMDGRPVPKWIMDWHVNNQPGRN